MQPPSRPGPAFQVFQPTEPGDPVLIGGYRVLARIGSGRLGTVYLGVAQSGRRLALKSVGPDLADDQEFRRRFKREIAAAQRVRGPFLGTAIDGHAEGVRPWVAFEFVPGPTLADAVQEYGPLPVPAVRVLMGSLAEALDTLHKAGTLHGDLRPSNVLLTEDGPRTVDFASLEHEPSAEGDVFMLGLVALFAATGNGTFPRPPRYEPPDLDGCPEELRGPIGRCLAARPEDRPEPGALAAELEAGRPAPDWLPAEISALLPAYTADPPRPKAPPPPSASPADPGPTASPAPAAPRTPSHGSASPVPPSPVPPSPGSAPPGSAPPGSVSAGGVSGAASPDTPASPSRPPVPAPATRPDGGAPGGRPPAPKPNFVVPEPPPQTEPIPVGTVHQVMGSYRHDLVVALGIGGGAFGILVLVLLLIFLA